jgi:hypothetical protein
VLLNSQSKVMLGSCLLSKPVGRSEEVGGEVEVWFGHFIFV